MNTEIIEKKTDKYLDRLHLPTIKKIYKLTAKTAENESWPHEEYLSDLVEKECEQRRNNRIERNLSSSKLPLEKQMNTFDTARLTDKLKIIVKRLSEGSFLGRKENVLVFGNPGSGKTHLLCAIGHELIKNGKRVFFTPCSFLVQDLLKAKKELMLGRIIKKYARYDALIIDDIGYVQHSKHEMEVLFTLLAQRYEQSSVMISTNLAFSDWNTIFKDPMVTAAAIDRLVHHSVIIELNLKSYRIEHAQLTKTNSKIGAAPMGAIH